MVTDLLQISVIKVKNLSTFWVMKRSQTHRGSLAEECIGLINKQQQSGIGYIMTYAHNISIDIILSHRIMEAEITKKESKNVDHQLRTRADLCWPSQRLCAWQSRRRGPWVLRHHQSWWHSPSQNALPASTRHKQKYSTILISDFPFILAFPSPKPQMYLSKQCFARSRRAVHEDVPVQAVVLPCVSCCYGNVAHTLFQGGLRDGKLQPFKLVRQL